MGLSQRRNLIPSHQTRPPLYSIIPECDDDGVVEDLEDGDEAAAHREAQDAPDVGNEPDRRHLLVALHLLRKRYVQLLRHRNLIK